MWSQRIGLGFVTRFRTGKHTASKFSSIIYEISFLVYVSKQNNCAYFHWIHKKKYWKFCGAQHKVSHFGFNLNQCSAQRAKIGQKMSFDHQRIE